MLLQSLTVEQFGDSERLALRKGVAALLGILQSDGTAPLMVTLRVEPASVRATAVVFAPNRTVATNYDVVLAAQTPQSLSAAIGVHYTGTSVLTVDALEGPFTSAVVMRQTSQLLALPSPTPPSCLVFENCPFGLPPPLPDILFFVLLALAFFGSMLLWCLIRRRCRNIEQQRKAQMAQRAAQETTAAVSLQASARSLLAKRTRKRAHAAAEEREAAARRLQALVRRTLQVRKMKRDLAAKLKAARLERAARAATTLQRGVRMTAHRRAVRGRAVEAKLAHMRSLAESVVQTHARRWLEAHRLRRSRGDSVYRRVRAHWLRMSRRGQRLQHLVIRWRAMADAVLEAPPGAPADAPLREVAVGLWQVLWRSLVLLRIVPATPPRRLKHTLLCRLRLAALAGRPRPNARPSPSRALPLLRELRGQLLTYKSQSYRSPSSQGASGRSLSSSPGWSPLPPFADRLASCAAGDAFTPPTVGSSASASRAGSSRTLPQRAGRFIVMDFLSSSGSRESADCMASAGLTPTTLFNKAQLPNASGYLSAAWACSLRREGLKFTMMDMASAQIPNQKQYVADRNVELGHTRDTSIGQFLETAEVQKLVTLHNPDAPNTDPSWLAGPGSFNQWHAYFQRTLEQAHEHGRVHIMIVNTVTLEALHDIASGRHWFVVAWFIEPEPAVQPAVQPAWSPAATTFRSSDVHSPPSRMLSSHGGVHELRRSSVDLHRASARPDLPHADVTSTMPQAQRLPPPEHRVPAPKRSSSRAITATTTTTTMGATADRRAPFAAGDAFTPPTVGSSASASRAGSSRVQPAAIRRSPTLSKRGSDASHTGAAISEGGAVPSVDMPRSSRSRSEVVPNRVPTVTTLDVASSDAAGVLAPPSGTSARAVSARQRVPFLGYTRERVAAHTEAQTNDRRGPPAVLSRGHSHAASVHV